MANGNFEVRNPAIEAALNQIGDRLRKTCESFPGVVFAFLLFDTKSNSIFYTSNARRQDVINAMREFIAKHEAN